MLTSRLFKGRFSLRLGRKREPRLIAVFSYRYDAHLVPPLIENIRPIVDGYVAFDDRSAAEPHSSEPKRRQALIRAAVELGAHWILAIDPDERLEARLAGRMQELTSVSEPVFWAFRLREMYTPESYRIDGIWGKKRQYRLFPAETALSFDYAPLHEPWCPRNAVGNRRKCGFNLYHLKMIAPARRLARRDVYRRLDPEQGLQKAGYDYLADETGAEFETIPRGREYRPVHQDDGGLWMPDPATLSALPP